MSDLAIDLAIQTQGLAIEQALARRRSPAGAGFPSDLLAELAATKLKLNHLLEQARGPGRHLVFRAIKEAYADVTDAVYAEQERNL